MIVKNFYTAKTIRFDVNPIINYISKKDTNQESELAAIIGSSESEPNIIIMSYWLHITRKSDDEEILGYRLEQGFAYILETKQKDKEAIEELLSIFYGSVKKHIEENTGIELVNRNDYDQISKGVISSLEDSGRYR